MLTLRAHLRESEKENLTLPFDKTSILKYRISTPNIKLEREYNPLVPLSLVDLWTRSREVEHAALQDAVKALRICVDDAVDLSVARAPLAKCEAEVLSAEKSLEDDLTLFFRNVELYRDGVFSHTTKESISTLGIGAQLDALELEFADADKASYTAAATASLFPNFRDFAAKALTRLALLDQKLRPLLVRIGAIKLSPPDLARSAFTPTFETEKNRLISILSAEIQKDIDELCRKLELRLSAATVDAREHYDSEMTKAKWDRRKRYFAIVSFTGFVCLGIYIGYAYLTQAASQSIFWVIGWSIVANLLGDTLGYITASMFDNFPETSTNIRKNAETKFRATILDLSDKEINGYEFEAMDDVKLKSQIVEIYNRILTTDPDGWHQRAIEQLRALDELYSEYTLIWAEYIEVVEEVISIVSSYFSDAGKNMELLNSIAGRIKEKAIEPSFLLLKNTRGSLDDVKRQILAVQFA